jgi:hypothetical protein
LFRCGFRNFCFAMARGFVLQQGENSGMGASSTGIRGGISAGINAPPAKQYSAHQHPAESRVVMIGNVPNEIDQVSTPYAITNAVISCRPIRQRSTR